MNSNKLYRALNIAARIISGGLLLLPLACGPVSTGQPPDLFRSYVAEYSTADQELEGFLLRHLISNELPGIESMADELRISRLRDWVYATADLAAPEDFRLDDVAELPFYQLPLPRVVALFLEDTGGVQSGGIAHFLMKLYHFFGYEAYNLDIGNRSTASHVTTLVKLPGAADYVIQDATFNLEFRDLQSNKLLTISEIQSRVETQQEASIRLVHGPTVEKDVLFTFYRFLENGELKGIPLETVRNFNSERTLVKTRLPMQEVQMSIFLNSLRPFLVESELPVSILQAYRFPFAVYGPESSELQNLRQELVEEAHE